MHEMATKLHITAPTAGAVETTPAAGSSSTQQAATT